MRLDRKIYFIEKVIEQGESNEDKITMWKLIDCVPMVWARRRERSGGTSVVNERVTFIQQTDWDIRFRGDLTVNMRLVSDSQVYEIVNISENNALPRKRYLILNTTLLDGIYFT